MNNSAPTIAYFSMEFAFHSDMPNYAGGLGVLAADMMYSCADLSLPVAGISLFYHENDNPEHGFPAEKYLTDTGKRVSVRIEDRDIQIAIWRKDLVGSTGHIVPMYFLSTYVQENEQWDRDLTKHLYDSGQYTRICQEAILGIGGVAALHELGFGQMRYYHMNEGHCAFLTLDVLRRNNYDEARTRELCTFTTHTPVAAGFDLFEVDAVYSTLPGLIPEHHTENYIIQDRFSMADLGLYLSSKVNSVSARHREVCEGMFPRYEFENITNGIYHPRWTGDAMAELFDQYLPDWRQNPDVFDDAPSQIPDTQLVEARHREKQALCGWVNDHPEFFHFDDFGEADYFSDDVLTVGFARRFVPYKRPELILQDIDRLLEIGDGKLQIIFAGKCHPDDPFCNKIRQHIIEKSVELRGRVKIALAPTYNLDIGKRMTSGVDIWLNNPVPPREASGTSGMKASLNGVLNLSVGDGWWLEGYAITPHAGWIFAGDHGSEDEPLNAEDAAMLLDCLENAVDIYYNDKAQWNMRMLEALRLMAQFTTHRSVMDYHDQMWLESDS